MPERRLLLAPKSARPASARALLRAAPRVPVRACSPRPPLERPQQSARLTSPASGAPDRPTPGGVPPL